LGDAAALLAGPSGWNTQKASSSNATAVGVTAGTTALAAALTVEVQQLARSQSTASAGVVAGGQAGASGSLNIELGSWDAAGAVFSPTTSVSVAIVATDTVSSMASKINAASAGVTALVLRDGANERLVIRSNGSGTSAGFRLNTPVDAGLAGLEFRNPSDGSYDALLNPTGFVGQTALDAKVKINGVDVVSATNKMVDAVAGVTLQLNQTTTTPAEIVVENDLDAIQKNIQSFVDAYNVLNATLADATKYDAAAKKGGILQSDATTVGLQNSLRAMLGSVSLGATFSTLSPNASRLSDAGIERQTDGSLKINSTRLTSAMSDAANLKNLFAQDNGSALTNGFGIKVRDFARGLVAFDGLVSNKSTALQGSISRNSKDQDRVNDRAARVEVQLRKQYTALDAQMAQMNGLSSYVTAQLAQWNKSSG
jgi:flagellar hook-associated protein 2